MVTLSKPVEKDEISRNSADRNFLHPSAPKPYVRPQFEYVPCSLPRRQKKVQSRTVRPAFYDFFRRDVRILYVLYLQSEYPNTLQPAQEPEGGPEQDTQAGIL